MKEIVENFLRHHDYQVETISHGLINTTLKVFINQDTEAFILQKINTGIFKEPEKLQQNYRYLSSQLKTAGSRFELPEIIPTVEGKDLFVAPNQQVWRMFAFIANSYTLSQTQTPEQAHEVALSFSRLTRDLAGADYQKVEPVIDRFHHIGFRHRQLQEAVKTNPAGRLQSAKKVLETLENYHSLLVFYQKLEEDGSAFRHYLLHHDAKLSNILFDKTTKKVITPIDMDTTMPGHFFSDSGDMIRTMASSTEENDTDYSRIEINRHHYQAIADGYLANMGPIFTKEENRLFHLSGLLVVYMQCLRFITDYLNGDTYYNTTHPLQNLERATNQLTLLQQLKVFVKAEYRIRINE